jgi:hypothetical protein
MPASAGMTGTAHVAITTSLQLSFTGLALLQMIRDHYNAQKCMFCPGMSARS